MAFSAKNYSSLNDLLNWTSQLCLSCWCLLDNFSYKYQTNIMAWLIALTDCSRSLYSHISETYG